MFEDKTLVCKDCGKEFVWTAGEQEFYAEHGFENEPKRCKDCRAAMKNQTRGERQMFDAVCAQLRQGLQGAVPASRGPSGLLQRVLRQDAPELIARRIAAGR